MKSFKDLIHHNYAQKLRRKWTCLYWAIDLHDTVIEGKYNKFNEGATLFPYAKETLDYLYSSNSHKTILWTSSHDEAIDEIIKRHDLKFHYRNDNPECPSTDMCNFGDKFYFNFLIDDKAGFESHDWKIIYETILEIDKNI